MACKIIILHERPQVEIIVQEQKRTPHELIRERIKRRRTNQNLAVPSLLQGLFQPQREEIAAQETSPPNYRLINGKERPLLESAAAQHNVIIQIESRYTGAQRKPISPHGNPQISLTISLPSAGG